MNLLYRRIKLLLKPSSRDPMTGIHASTYGC
jgi:hypothetical protein